MENEQHLTIKEKREKQRLEKLQKREDNKEVKTKQRTFLWIAVATALLAVVVGIVVMVKNTPKNTEADTPVMILDSVSSKDWIRGSSTASTNLIEYGDFECPACRDFYSVVKELEKDFGGDVRFVFRHFPLTQHVNAKLAARAAEAAGAQGKFWEMHDLLYEHQKAWSGKGSARKTFEEYAASLNLNAEQFKKDFESKEIGQTIDENTKSGLHYGVNSTPTFYLNNTKLSLKSFEELRQLISNEIKPKP